MISLPIRRSTAGVWWLTHLSKCNLAYTTEYKLNLKADLFKFEAKFKFSKITTVNKVNQLPLLTKLFQGIRLCASKEAAEQTILRTLVQLTTVVSQAGKCPWCSLKLPSTYLFSFIDAPHKIRVASIVSKSFATANFPSYFLIPAIVKADVQVFFGSEMLWCKWTDFKFTDVCTIVVYFGGLWYFRRNTLFCQDRSSIQVREWRDLSEPMTIHF